MAKPNWNASHIPDQKGKIVIITGSTSGVGKETARTMAGKKATVIMAVRNVAKGRDVENEIRMENPNANISTRELNLSSLSSIKAFAEDFNRDHDQLDILINNAGIMLCPFSRTEDSFEIQMGTNHLGHFALTGHLMPLLKKTKGSRITNTSSLGHRGGNIDFSDLNWEKRKYKSGQAYADSKIANLYFTFELVRKLKNNHIAPIVTSSHPGWTRSELQRHSRLMRLLNIPFSQGPDQGSLPCLRSVIDPDSVPGDYYGPSRLFEFKGPPVKVKTNSRSKDEQAAQKLWALSEELTGVRY